MTPLHVIRGTVVEGDQRGRTLGFPTANVRLATDADGPGHGVYAGLAVGLPAAISVGVRPTFGAGLQPLVEAHIIDFEGDLYGREITIELLAYLRPELEFDSVDALVEQMAADIEHARAILESNE